MAAGSTATPAALLADAAAHELPCPGPRPLGAGLSRPPLRARITRVQLRYLEDRRCWGLQQRLLLVGVAGLMLFESVARLLGSQPIHYQQAIGIALLGLLVNPGLCTSAPGTITAITVHDHITVITTLARSPPAIRISDLRAAYLPRCWRTRHPRCWRFWRWWEACCGADWLDPLMGIAGGRAGGGVGRGCCVTGRVLLDAEMDAPWWTEIHPRGDRQSCLTPGSAICTSGGWGTQYAGMLQMAPSPGTGDPRAPRHHPRDWCLIPSEVSADPIPPRRVSAGDSLP